MYSHFVSRSQKPPSKLVWWWEQERFSLFHERCVIPVERRLQKAVLNYDVQNLITFLKRHLLLSTLNDYININHLYSGPQFIQSILRKRPVQTIFTPRQMIRFRKFKWNSVENEIWQQWHTQSDSFCVKDSPSAPLFLTAPMFVFCLNIHLPRLIKTVIFRFQDLCGTPQFAVPFYMLILN